MLLVCYKSVLMCVVLKVLLVWYKYVRVLVKTRAENWEFLPNFAGHVRHAYLVCRGAYSLRRPTVLSLKSFGCVDEDFVWLCTPCSTKSFTIFHIGTLRYTRRMDCVVSMV
jgi:hypothetical protein